MAVMLRHLFLLIFLQPKNLLKRPQTGPKLFRKQFIINKSLIFLKCVFPVMYEMLLTLLSYYRSPSSLVDFGTKAEGLGTEYLPHATSL